MSRVPYSRFSGAQSSNPGQTAPIIELEKQFILRLPEEPAQALRHALQAGASNVKERLTIQLEPETETANDQQQQQQQQQQQPSRYLRKGQVKFDGWNMSAKLMDLPTIIESQKTIDKKTFYKTADICQILVCRDGEEDVVEPEVTEPEADKKKADKKYQFNHGLCPPLKNCRKRRFRKTLKKKFVEAPEIEKEVKRLLRVDNEAVEVKYELLTEDDLKNSGQKLVKIDSASAISNKEEESNLTSKEAVDEHDLFGALSDDSDEDEVEVEVTKKDPGDKQQRHANEDKPERMVTQFSAEMFESKPGGSGSGMGAVAAKLESLSKEVNELKMKKQEMERNSANCINPVLLGKFQESVAVLEAEIASKEAEIEGLSMFS